MLIGDSIGIYTCLLIIALSAINIFINEGIHRKTFSMLVSVLLVSGVTGLIIWLICRGLNLNLYQDEVMRFNGIRSASGVVLSLYLIFTLGIFIDIISTMINYLDDEKDKTVDVGLKEQFIGGLEITKKYIGEKINMIIFAVLSVSLFSICVNINNDMKFFEIFTEAHVFQYILIAIVANIGVVLCAPIASIVYALFNRKKTIYKTVSENKVDGKRSLKL